MLVFIYSNFRNPKFSVTDPLSDSSDYAIFKKFFLCLQFSVKYVQTSTSIGTRTFFSIGLKTIQIIKKKKDDENDLLLLNYWCSTCDVRTLSLSDMTEHLRSENHFDIVSMINRVCAQHNVVGKCFKNWPYFLYKKTYVYSC